MDSTLWGVLGGIVTLILGRGAEILLNRLNAKDAKETTAITSMSAQQQQLFEQQSKSLVMLWERDATNAMRIDALQDENAKLEGRLSVIEPQAAKVPELEARLSTVEGLFRRCVWLVQTFQREQNVPVWPEADVIIANQSLPPTTLIHLPPEPPNGASSN